MTPTDEVKRAYELVDKVLQPLLRGDGKRREVEPARVAYGSLNLIRQWALVGARHAESAAVIAEQAHRDREADAKRKGKRRGT